VRSTQSAPITAVAHCPRRFGQKIVGERRRSRFAELDGSSSADGNFFTIHTGNFALDTIIYVLYMISIELRST
jgi:hypothetical protein